LGKALESLSLAKMWGCSHFDEICLQALERGILDCTQLKAYYRCLNYDLGREQKAGLELYFQHLVSLSEITRVPPLQVYSSLACVA